MLVHCLGPPAGLGHASPQLPGGQPADASELSPAATTRVDVALCLWSHDFGLTQGQSLSTIIISPVMVTVVGTAICP